MMTKNGIDVQKSEVDGGECFAGHTSVGTKYAKLPRPPRPEKQKEEASESEGWFSKSDTSDEILDKLS